MHRGAACRWQAFSIDRAGRRDLIPKSRLYVHLSSDKETAKKVGSRHGRPVVYEIDCRQMEVELSVRFDDRSVTYDVTELDELVLAYATTIHKS